MTCTLYRCCAVQTRSTDTSFRSSLTWENTCHRLWRLILCWSVHSFRTLCRSRLTINICQYWICSLNKVSASINFGKSRLSFCISTFYFKLMNFRRIYRSTWEVRKFGINLNILAFVAKRSESSSSKHDSIYSYYDDFYDAFCLPGF